MSTTSTPSNKVFNPPSISTINSPFPSAPVPIPTHDERQTLQIDSDALHGVDEISDHLRQDRADGFQVAALSTDQHVCLLSPASVGGRTVTVGRRALGGRAGDSGRAGAEGGYDGVEVGLSLKGGECASGVGGAEAADRTFLRVSGDLKTSMK